MKRNEKKRKLFVLMTLVLCLLLLLERLTGEICHVILGVILMTMILVHVRREIGKLKGKKLPIRLVDWGLFGVLATVFLTGMMLHPLQGVLLIKVLHKLSSVLLVLGMIVHVVQHKKR